jgi:hypothetical protein
MVDVREDVVDISEQQVLDAPPPPTALTTALTGPSTPLMPYLAPKPLDAGIKPLKPVVGSATLQPAPGMTEQEYNTVISQTFVSNPQATQDWEVAQGWKRFNQLMYGVTY